MKYLYNFLTIGVLLLLFSCNDSPPIPSAINEDIMELKIVTEYDADSLTKEVYQVDIKTNNREGWYKFYDENQQIQLERFYKNNKVDGIEKTFYPSGTLESTFVLLEGNYHGKFKIFFEDGRTKAEGTYIDNKIEGVHKSYYSNGNLKEEVYLVANMTQGPFKEFNENGTIKTEGTYNTKEDREDLETGELKKYDTNGELIEKMLCSDGHCCTVWTKEKGEVKPSNNYCATIIASVRSEAKEVK